MYRCHYCGDVSKPGQPMLRHTTYQKESKRVITREVIVSYNYPGRPIIAVQQIQCNEGKRILSEVPICKDCNEEISEIGVLRFTTLLNLRKGGIDKSATTFMAKPANIVRFGS